MVGQGPPAAADDGPIARTRARGPGRRAAHRPLGHGVRRCRRAAPDHRRPGHRVRDRGERTGTAGVVVGHLRRTRHRRRHEDVGLAGLRASDHHDSRAAAGRLGRHGRRAAAVAVGRGRRRRRGRGGPADRPRRRHKPTRKPSELASCAGGTPGHPAGRGDVRRRRTGVVRLHARPGHPRRPNRTAGSADRGRHDRVRHRLADRRAPRPDPRATAAGADHDGHRLGRAGPGVRGPAHGDRVPDSRGRCGIGRRFRHAAWHRRAQPADHHSYRRRGPTSGVRRGEPRARRCGVDRPVGRWRRHRARRGRRDACRRRRPPVRHGPGRRPLVSNPAGSGTAPPAPGRSRGPAGWRSRRPGRPGRAWWPRGAGRRRARPGRWTAR